MENNPKVTVISVFVVLAVVLCGTFYMKTRGPGITNVPRPDAPLPEGPNLEQRFVDFLNDFLRDVNKGMVEYKKERQALVQALGPANLRDPAYVEENYLFVQTVIPSLRQRMADVIKIFEDAEMEVDALLLNQPPDIQKKVLDKWKEMKQRHGEAFISYFELENELLTAYDNLMAFYNSRKGAFEVDLNSRTVIFKDPADAVQEERLRGVITQIYAEEEALLNKNEAVPAPPPVP